jgi:hypothetical protein
MAFSDRGPNKKIGRGGTAVITGLKGCLKMVCISIGKCKIPLPATGFLEPDQGRVRRTFKNIIVKRGGYQKRWSMYLRTTKRQNQDGSVVELFSIGP